MFPYLILVTGRPGAGKSTLSQALAERIGFELISRDQLFEEFAISTPGAPDLAKVAVDSFDRFFEVIRQYLRDGASVIAEAAFRPERWTRGLAGLESFAYIRIVRCDIDPSDAIRRILHRQQSVDPAEHLKAHTMSPAHTSDIDNPPEFQHLTMDVPSIIVDAKRSLENNLDEVILFLDIANSN